jgi:STE24 endopeptidase
MDASRRSRHTNAYFTGIGENKRIVLFDTLLRSHEEEEILAILSHEIAHWKKKHVLKQIVLMEVLSLALFYIVGQLMNWQLLYQTFGFDQPNAFAGLVLAGAILSPLGFLVQPVGSAISRKFEREADDYAVILMQTAGPMQKALKRLAVDNLSNLSPHPLYAWFYYSHPSLGERIARLGTRTIISAPTDTPSPS